MGHIFVNRKTTKMCHHAGEYQYLKQFYKDNEHVHKQDPASVLSMNIDGEQMVAKKTQYRDTDTMFKAVGGVLMWSIHDHIIRPYSYASMVILRVCHEYRWFMSMATDVKSQIKLLETYVELMWAQNATRARHKEAPMTFTEAMAYVKEEISVTFNQAAMADTDPYCTKNKGNCENCKKLQSANSKLEREVQELKSQLEEAAGVGTRLPMTRLTPHTGAAIGVARQVAEDGVRAAAEVLTAQATPIPMETSRMARNWD